MANKLSLVGDGALLQQIPQIVKTLAPSVDLSAMEGLLKKVKITKDIQGEVELALADGSAIDVSIDLKAPGIATK